MENFNNKNALITGAGNGIGLAIAKKLASHGMNIIGVDLNQENLNKLKKTEVLGSKQIDRYGKNIITAVTRALQIPTKNLPRYPRKTAPLVPAIVAKRVKELRTWRDRTARQLKVDPAIIGTKALISAIAVQKPLTISSLSKMKRDHGRTCRSSRKFKWASACQSVSREQPC